MVSSPKRRDAVRRCPMNKPFIRGQEKGFATNALPASPTNEVPPRPSRVIAEALLGRYGPQQITDLSVSFGFPRPLTQVIVAACTATACDCSWSRRRITAVAQ